MVQIEIINEQNDNQNELEVLFKETDRAFVNAIRRALIVDTPKMAIHHVRFEQGTVIEDGVVWETIGPLPDEVIAHRLAMVPIPTNHDDFSFMDECPKCADLVPDDRGCPECTIIYQCSARGVEEGHSVLARHINVLGDTSLQIPDEFGDIVLTKLFKGQRLEFYAKAILGVGGDHVKWSPCAGVTFVPRQVAKLKDKKKAKLLWGLGLETTEKDFKKNQLDDISKVAILRDELVHVGPSTDLGRDFEDAIILEDVEGEFILSFETDGSMTARVAFEKSIESLQKRFVGLQEQMDTSL